jgi:hypothetical protein
MHRKHASVYDVPLCRISVAGYLVRAEVAALRRLTADIQRPYVVVLGGAKVADKFDALGSLLAVAFPFLAARGLKTGTSLLEPGQVDAAEPGVLPAPEVLRRGRLGGAGDVRAVRRIVRDDPVPPVRPGLLGAAVRVAGTKLTVAAGLLAVAGGLWQLSTASAATTYTGVLPGLVLLGVGAGLAIPSATESVMGSLPAAHTGVGSATNGAFLQIGGALGWR